MVAIYRGRITIDVLKAVSSSQKRLHEAHGQIAGLTLLLSTESFSRPDASVRQYGETVSHEFDSMAYASAIVLTESGLHGALVRSILTGIQLASRRPVPQRVFASVREAVEWIASKNAESPLGPRVAEVQRRIEMLAAKPARVPVR
ncbi:hypothetical protein [Sandaracinus amylolyticus]|uniref:STAS/SEC14 domain-containing protein n=1 Tax=Sandaracinus amylolyticus TaxID=927083 RepID=A0A0F6W7I5_9BACT|nr:hypothetical protein [Sandaracinus amylolyticus]AKF09493.1 hypothetical protein DB32_006642 [Sandaracinus amylolyticus]